jgi:hypothetical protein
MRKSVRGALLLFFIVVGVAAQVDSGWVRVAPEGGGFAAMMPGKPDEQSQTKEKITTHAYIAKLGRGVYMVSYSDYDSSVKFDPQTELEADRDNFNKVLKATLLTTKNITMDGRQGIEFTSETEVANIKSKVFVRGNRVFQQAVLIFKDSDQTKTVEAFFESFAFVTTN